MLSKNAWEEFLASEEIKLREIYSAKKERLLSDANQERESRKDYSSREILEILQNADDAATESQVEGSVKFELTEDGLIIGNTGKPFSKDGLGSILLAHNSPKREKSGTLIGAKGLGFRSLLNWSKNPILLSGNLEVGFSRDYSEEQVGLLCQHIPGLRDGLEKSRTQPPILSFPYWKELERWSDPILHRARRMAAGYDTVIALPFQGAELRKIIIEQLEAISPRLLLFLQSVNRIEIGGKFLKERTLNLEVEDGISSLSLTIDGERTREKWLTKSRIENLPLELLDDNEIRQKYQMTSAIRIDDDCDSEPLSSFFPTRHKMPFAGLFHATLDLEQNRQQIRDNSVNSFVLERLGSLHAEFLEELADKGILDPIRYMQVDRTPEGVIETFVEHFFIEARERAIIRTRSGRFVPPGQAKAFPKPEHDFEDQRRFRNFVIPHDSSDREVLERLGVDIATEEEIVAEIADWKLSIPQRASLVLQLVNQDFDCPDLRRLLVGEGGGAGKSSTKWFPPQTQGVKRLASFPDGLGLRFINRELWECLCRNFGDAEMAILEMSAFGVEKFDPRQIIEAFSLRINELESGQRANLVKRRFEFLSLLAVLYKGSRTGVQSLANIDIWWPNQDGVWALASELHIAEPNTKKGRVNSVLFTRRPDLLASQAQDLGLNLEKGELESFLIWIGVNNWPRKISRRLEPEDLPLLLSAYPALISYKDNRGNRKEENIGDHGLSVYNTPRLEGDTEWIVALKDILDCGSDHAILEWLGSEDGGLLEKLSTQLFFKPPGNAIPRKVQEAPEPSLVLSKVSSTCWMRDDLGILRAPKELLQRTKKLRSLQSPYLSLDIIGPKPFLLDEKAIRGAFARAGVSPDLDSAAMPALFRCLLRLSDWDAEPREVMPIYRRIAEKTGWSVEKGGEAADEFLDRGLIMARGPSGFQWYRPQEVSFVSGSDTFRKAISTTRPIIDVGNANKNFLSVMDIKPLIGEEIKFIGVRTEQNRPDLLAGIDLKFEHAKRWVDLWAAHSGASNRRRQAVQIAKVWVAESVILELQVQGEHLGAELSTASCIYHDGNFFLGVGEDCTKSFFSDFGSSKLAECIGEFLELTGMAGFKEMFRARTPAARCLHLQDAFPELDPSAIDIMLNESSDEQDDESFLDSKVSLPPLQRAAEIPYKAPLSDQHEHAAVSQIDDLVTRLKVSDHVEEKNDFGWVAAKTEFESAKTKKNSHLKHGGRPKSSKRVSVSSTGIEEEEEAFRFEQDQKRFPLRVDMERGLASEGCDLVSFNSEADLNDYLKTRDSSLVARFIEVKGSELRLSKSQTKAAEKYRNRYYIYSVDLGVNGYTAIEWFCDPAYWSEPEDWVLIVDRERAPRSQRKRFSREVKG